MTKTVSVHAYPRLIRKAILAWNSFRARKQLERSNRRTEKVIPEVAKNRRAIEMGRRHHRATREALKAQQTLITSALRGEI